MVERSPPERRNRSAPPSGGWLWRIWWLWVYWPRKMVALEGQHKEFVANAFSKVVPSSINALRLGMCFSVLGFTSSRARSSVRISTTLGGFGSFLSSFVVSSAGGRQPASAKQPTSSNRKGKVGHTLLTRMANL